MGCDIQVFSQGSRGLKQMSEAELLESPVVVRKKLHSLCCLQSPLSQSFPIPSA